MKYHLYCLLAALYLVAVVPCYAQDSSSAPVSYGVGGAFGVVYPRTDVRQSKDSPFARLFVRLYPSQYLAFESGVGIGQLEAEASGRYFKTYIYPIDARILIMPLQGWKANPYLYAGIGFLPFNPTDKNDQPLPYNAAGYYKKITPFFPLGAGVEVPISELSMVGVTGGYNMTSTEYLDDYKGTSKDGYWSIMVHLFAFIRGMDDDWDKDGLSNDYERTIGTDPHKADTDGDGLTDGDEVLKYHTNPLKKDTDADGLTDYEEIMTYHTDPNNPDSDGDGLSDGDEILKYHTDPLVKDTDGDGLNDGEEVLKYHTDPLVKDTDGDGLNDGDEVTRYKTDPLRKDTDNDGLTDGDEVLKYKTNPLKQDTDGGGMPDGKEIQLGLNPLDPSDDVPIISVGERIVLEGVNFETNKNTLLPSARTILDQVAASLAAYPSAQVAIHGHTDNVGGAKYNMKLSTNRAEAVKAYLVTKGIDPGRITTKGFGFTKPIADNATPEGRAKNRRIEFIRVK
jgi:outer membrane protein OmpA-like peptidoglycan-associated protein